MKKCKIIIALFAVLAFTACQEKGDKYAFQYVTFKESIPYKQGQEHPSCSFDLNVLKAHGTDTVFADAFNVDISYFLFDKRTTDVRGAMIHFIDSVLNIFKEENREQIRYAQEEGFEPRDIDYEYVINTEVHYGNGRDIIGHFINMYQYTGGAHGGTFISGMTFRKSDGRRVEWDLFTKSMQDVIKKGLKKYFEVNTDEELENSLSLENTYMLPLPATPPVFTKEGVMFTYQQYEIAAYAAGLPSFIVPYDEAKSLMNTTGKNLLP